MQREDASAASSMDVDALAASHCEDWHPQSFLARLHRETLHTLLSAGSIVRFRAGETLIDEGADGTVVYLLLSSFVKVTARLADAAGEALLAVRSGGDIVGELAATDGERRSASVKACGKAPVIAVVVDRVALSDILASDPQATLVLAASISAKLRSATSRRVDYTGFPPKVRLARVLVELAGMHSHHVGASRIIGVDLTQLELGTLVGVKSATAERAMRQLRAEGLIDTGGRRPVIRDMDALHCLAEGVRHPGATII